MSNSSLISHIKISPNKNSPRNHVIDTITIHCVVGQLSVETICNVFQPTRRQASCNYAIGVDGRIGLCVDEKDRSWCSSNAVNDNRAITIEVASDKTHPYAVNDKAYAALVKLCADICKRNNIKELKWKGDKSLIGQVDKQNMTVHRWFANKSCPGDYLYNRHTQIANEVNAILNNNIVTPTPTTPTTSLYRVGTAWINGKCVNQIGAYSVLSNATSACKSGYYVFDTNGIIVYPTPVKTLKIGDKVRLTGDALVYNTNKRFSEFVYKSDLYVRDMVGNRVVISTLKTGAVTGAVDRKYLKNT